MTPAEEKTAELIRLALDVRSRSHAPYSGFHVGSALRTQDGRTWTGANVENASYGLSVCAERNAVMQAVLAGARGFVELVVATPISPPAAPCGMCRQTLAEFAKDMPITLVNPQGDRVRTSLAELLPLGFFPEALGK